MAKLPVIMAFTVIDKTSRYLDNINRKLQAINVTSEKTNKSLKATTKHIEAAQSRISKFGSLAGQIGAGATAGITGPIAAIGTAWLRAGADFELGMVEMGTRIDATATELEKIGDLARNIGLQTGLGVQQAIAAYTQLGKNGVKTAELLTGAGDTAVLLAKSENLTMGEAADMLTTPMDMFDISKTRENMKKMGDQLGKTVDLAAIEMQDVWNSMKHAGPASFLAGVMSEEVLALIATLGKLGIRGETGGSSIKSLMQTLTGDERRQRLMEAAGAKREDFFEGAGTTNMRPMDQVLKRLKELNWNAEQYQNFFGKEFGSTLQRLVASGSTYTEMLEGINKSEGMLMQRAMKRVNTFWGQWDVLRESFKDIGVSLAKDGTLDVFTDLLRVAIKMVNWFNKLNPKTKAFVMIFSGLLALLPPLIMGFGLFIMALNTIKTLGWVAALGLGFWTVAILGAVAALAFYLANMEKINRGAAIMWQNFKDWGSDAIEWVLKKLNLMPQIMNKVMEAMGLSFRYPELEVGDWRAQKKMDDQGFAKSMAEPSELAKFAFDKYLSKGQDIPLVLVDFANVPRGVNVRTEGDVKTHLKPADTGANPATQTPKQKAAK